MNDILDLHDILEGCPGITPAKAALLQEGCVVCLNRNNHVSRKTMEVRGISSAPLDLSWDTIFDAQMDRTWKDQQEATEHGAECIAALMALKFTDYTVIARSRKGTGVDYWLGYDGDALFQNKARLEVSGIFQDYDKIEYRVAQKRKQTDRSAGTVSLPAYVCVVEFSKPCTVFVQR